MSDVPVFWLIRGGSLGDGLLAFPALLGLRRAHPECPLVMAGNDALRSLFMPYVTRYLSLDELGHALFQPHGDPPTAWSCGARIALWMADPAGLARSNLHRWGAGEVVYVPGFRPGHHAAAQLMESIHHWGIDGPSVPILQLGGLSPEVSGPQADVVVHPGSGSRVKNWPLENFLKVARRLQELGFAVAFLLGPAEEDQGLHAILTSRSFRVLSGLTIAEVARLLSKARAYVGNDSGISHLAGLVGCSTVAIFGRTDPSIWCPLGLRVRVVGGNSLLWPSVEEVFDAVMSFLS